MAYDLLFLSKQRTFALDVPTETWEKLRFEFNPQQAVDDYLGETADWVNEMSRVGFTGCGIIKSTPKTQRVTFALSQQSLRRVLLTLSYLLTELNAYSDWENGFLILQVGCGSRHPLTGYVSTNFRRGLKQIAHCDKIVINMRRAFVAVTPRNMHRYATECQAVIDTRKQTFLFRCFGDACDMGIYPDSHSEPGHQASFSSHNLDYAYQQATLLAGFATVSEYTKKTK